MKKVLIGVFLVLLILDCSNQKKKVILQRELFEDSVKSFLAIIAQEDQELEYHFRKVESHLYEPVYALRFSLLEAYQILELSRVEFQLVTKPITGEINENFSFSQLGHERLLSVSELAKSNMNHLFKTVQNILVRDYQVFQLDSNQLEEILDDLKTETLTMSSNIDSVQWESRSNSDKVFKFLNLQAHFYRVLNLFREQLDYLAYGSRADSFTSYFPVIKGKSSECMNKGDSLNLEIAIGTYYSSIDNRYCSIVANGDTLSINAEGYAIYEQFLNTSGDHELKIECILINPVTGGIDLGKAVYHYKVN